MTVLAIPRFGFTPPTLEVDPFDAAPGTGPGDALAAADDRIVYNGHAGLGALIGASPMNKGPGSSDPGPRK